MKVGTHPVDDLGRVRAAREAIGAEAELFVDANGAYGRKQALAMADQFAELGVVWFEEPVSSDDLEGLRLIRDRGPAGMEVASGEYGYDLTYFRRMLEAGAFDVLQADATRCAGITGFLRVGALCESRPMPLSAHCAPSLHAHPACSLPNFRHLEYFHDHDRIEHMLPRKAQPVPPIFQPEVAAEAIVWASQNDRRELAVGWPTVEAVVGNKIAPGWLDAYLARTCYDGQMTGEPEDPSRPNNLWEPADRDRDHGAHGTFDSRSSGSSWQLWADIHRGWLALAGVGLACATLLARGRRSVGPVSTGRVPTRRER